MSVDRSRRIVESSNRRIVSRSRPEPSRRVIIGRGRPEPFIHSRARAFERPFVPFALRAARCSGVSSFLPIARASRCADETRE